MTLYELLAPTQWACAPDTWSSTALDEFETCPRRWQLLRSRWGEYQRFPVRPSPASIEGQIVHDALDRLTRACGQRGNPPLGSDAFVAATVEGEFFTGFARAILDWQEILGAHPRPGPPFRLKATPQELANRAIRMFREQYRPTVAQIYTVAEKPARVPDGVMNPGALLQAKGALSEVKLRHTTLPFMGILDRVHLIEDGIEVIDYKTGRPSESHQQQLLRYAVLWWRVTGDMPVRVKAQYLDSVSSWTVSSDVLESVENQISQQLKHISDALDARPAEAKPGSACRWCPVRARCDSGWALAEESAHTEGQGDSELLLVSAPGEHGFLARSKAGAEIAVVYQPAVRKLLPPITIGQVIRVLGGQWRAKNAELEIKVWTECFVTR